MPDLKDIVEATRTAATSPVAFLSLVLLVIAAVVPKLVDPNKDPHRLRYGVLFGIFAIAIGGFAWSVYGHYVALSEPVFVPAPPASPQPPAPAAPMPAPPPTTSPAPSAPPVAQAPTRVDCGATWTGWVDVGTGVGSPCPSGCTRGAELGQSFRSVGFPPRPQVKHKFQCWR